MNFQKELLNLPSPYYHVLFCKQRVMVPRHRESGSTGICILSNPLTYINGYHGQEPKSLLNMNFQKELLSLPPQTLMSRNGLAPSHYVGCVIKIALMGLPGALPNIMAMGLTIP
jgi:hypothetical protein